MKIMASKREYPTFEDYRESGEFSIEQLTTLSCAFSMGMSPKQISLLANPEFTKEQMDAIFHAIDRGISIRQLSLYADPAFSDEQMDVLTSYARHAQGCDFSAEDFRRMASPELSPVEMTALGLSVVHKFTDEQYRKLLDLIEHFHITRAKDVYDYVFAAANNLTLQQADLVYNPNFNRAQLYVVLDGFICGLPYEQVKLYADPKIESEKMEELRVALSNEAPIDDIVEFLSDEYSCDDVRDYCYDMGYYANEDGEDGY